AHLPTTKTYGPTPILAPACFCTPCPSLPDVGLSEPVARTWQHVSQMNRAELEDGFLRLHDENLVLKEFACKQEDRIKRLGTKLLRRTHERAQVEGQLGARARWSGQDLEESLEELQERVWDLERRNEGLRSRLLSYKQQLQLHGCRRHWPYGYVQPRVDTGLRQVHTSGGRVTERHHRGEGDGSGQGVGETPLPPLGPVLRALHSRWGGWGKESLSVSSLHPLVPGFSHSVPGPSILAALQQGGAGVPFSCLCWSFFLPLPHQNQETLRTSSEALLAQVEELTVQLKAETQKVLALESKVESVSFLQGALEEVGSPKPWGPLFPYSEASFPEVSRGPISLQPPCLDRLPTEQEELFAQQSLSRRLRETEAAHADTILELEKTRDMLILQHRLNQDYQVGEVVVQGVTDPTRVLCQQKMAQLLDLRSTRIRQLEEQLKDVAYGTRQLPLLRTEGDVDVEEVKAPVLRRGENLFELHIAGAVLSGEALQLLGEVQPVTFCTYAFYDFETHCTPVVRGAQPRYSFTSQYVIQAEPLFLQYLQRAAARLDLHLATATDHSTLASCWLRFREVLGSGERMHATAMLHGPSGENYGMLEYWMRLCLPMEQTIRLHCERTKALGYLLACMPQARAAQQSRQQDKEGWLWNELQVQIVGCTGLRGRWLSTQPSPYAMYRFFTFPDHDTPIIPSSNNPHFGDLRTFPMHPTAELDRYLRLESLWVYIFDDEDTEPGSYLGKAQIPLLPLARGHCITGDFVLTDPAGHPNGSISLSLEWKRQYLPPGAALHQAAWARKHQHERPLEQLIEEERAALHNQVQNDPAAQNSHLPHTISPSCPKAGCSHTLHGPWSGWEGRGRAGPIIIPLPVTSTLFLPAPEEAGEPALESSSDAQTTDSDEIVVGTSLGSPPKVDMERIHIEIVSLSLHPEAEAMASEHIQQLYVEYHFPGVPLAETETPLSLRNPSTWLFYGEPTAPHCRLQFVVVSEPLPGTGGECEDVGFAYIDLREILLTGNDVLEHDLDGELKVSVEAAAALCTIYWEGRRKAEEE
uniref:RPGR interacting protein 1 n=1 Tax=Terrapene triunguis TaxID=2587831 RepID=A0A674IZ96_9SAUR